MAIQQRRGNYANFDKSRMLAGEPAVVLQNDPSVTDGRAFYIAFGPNDVKRVLTEDELDQFETGYTDPNNDGNIVITLGEGSNVV